MEKVNLLTDRDHSNGSNGPLLLFETKWRLSDRNLIWQCSSGMNFREMKVLVLKKMMHRWLRSLYVIWRMRMRNGECKKMWPVVLIRTMFISSCNIAHTVTVHPTVQSTVEAYSVGHKQARIIGAKMRCGWGWAIFTYSISRRALVCGYTPYHLYLGLHVFIYIVPNPIKQLNWQLRLCYLDKAPIRVLLAAV